ncbi:DUF2332 domain-containing protein [Boseongicola aestuarii]|uniref:DUF2332 domain-containing protein n=1 Tax=Boseongicola aestuarii TaxID=1470561 RepID=A0A238J2L5_9RHOB|nr:DUF2332 family protein [Boseongicola aestuarii]SMX24573.1 hypothetical protein BOA8489_02699 [Boseongicola aestuarii]
MTYDIPRAFRAQSVACAKLGSPFMERLMLLFAERLTPGTPVADRVFGWTGDPRPQSDNVPLRLAGALHALRIEGLALDTVYPPHTVDDDDLWHEINRTLEAFPDRILNWLESAPQTNEVRRSAVLLPALAVVEARFNRPIEVLELGASGGLNLFADQFHLQLPNAEIGPPEAKVRLCPDWTGPTPPTALPTVASRRGVDLNPLDPTRPQDRLRLLAYLWPDQPDRLERTSAAIDLAMTAPAQIDQADAGDWLTDVLDAPSGLGRVVFHTIAAQYFPAATKAKVTTALARAGATATPLMPFAHLGMEADGGLGAVVTLTMWPGGETKEIARADFHGRWVNWTGV